MIDLGLSEEQQMLKKVVRDFVDKECPKRLVREVDEGELGYHPELWRKMANLGWLAMIFPEKYGGIGGSILDLAIACEELGRGLVPGPIIPTVICGLAILNGGTEEQKMRFIPKIASGEAIFTLAFTEPSFGWDPALLQTTAVFKHGSFIINGIKLFVPYAVAANHILCITRDTNINPPEAGINLLVVASGSQGLSRKTLEGFTSDWLGEIVFENVEVPEANLIGGLNKGWLPLQEALEVGTILLCAEMVGGAQFVVDMTIDYANQRIQFGRPIGSFQYVQERIIRMVNDLDKSRLVTYEAAWRLSEGLPASLEISVAKAICSNTYSRICLESHHVLAGIGYMKDHDLHLYTKKARTTQHFLGDAVFHRQIIAEHLGIT